MDLSRWLVPLVLGLVLQVQPVLAEKAYVSDSFEVTFRSGPSIENRVLALLSSGEPVEVLQSRDDWSRVRLLGSDRKSQEGWILTRYLIRRPPWKARAEALEQENEKLKKEVTDLRRKWERDAGEGKEALVKLEQTEAALAELEEQYRSLRQEASDYLELKSVYEDTKKRLQSTTETARALSLQMEKLQSSKRERWLATGALILLFGLLIGGILGRQQRKRKSAYF